MINNNIDKIKSVIYKHGISKSIDIIVGGIDTIKQIYNNNPSEFLNQFNDLTIVETDDKIVYVDKDRLPLFYYYPDEIDGYVSINYDRIWMFFSDVIGLKYSEIQTIINNWLEEIYNIIDLIPLKGQFSSASPVGRYL